MSGELRAICVIGVLAVALATEAQTGPDYVGSKNCMPCHERHGVSWSETTHSRFMRPPANDETIAAAELFQVSSPIRIDDVAFVLGHMHKLVFLKEDANRLVLLANQYDYDKNMGTV